MSTSAANSIVRYASIVWAIAASHPNRGATLVHRTGKWRTHRLLLKRLQQSVQAATTQRHARRSATRVTAPSARLRLPLRLRRRLRHLRELLLAQPPLLFVPRSLLPLHLLEQGEGRRGRGSSARMRERLWRAGRRRGRRGVREREWLRSGRRSGTVQPLFSLRMHTQTWTQHTA